MKLTKLLLALTALSIVSCCESAKGATVVFNIDTIVTGATPSGPPPWGTVTFTDVSPNSVMMEIQSNLPTSSNDFIGQLNFNWLDTGIGWNHMTATTITKPTGFSNFSVDFGSDSNGISGGAGAKFNGMVNLSQGNDKFGGTDYAKILLTHDNAYYVGTFDVNTFVRSTNGSNGEFVTAHIQGIDVGNSSWVTATQVPEPSAALLGGLGIIGLLRRKRH